MISNLEDTIVAIATPFGDGAIGVLRLSGPHSLSILEKVWTGKIRPLDFESRHVYLGNIHAFADNKKDQTIDQVLAFVMRAPASYTGEDTVEVQGHGGRRVMEMLLKNFEAAGARLADPGEFTKRAFLNGRMDLTKAEAVADLIHASSDQAVQLAERQLSGKLSDYVSRLRNELKVMRAQAEAMIDFPDDEDVQGLQYEEVERRTERILQQIRQLLQTYDEGRFLREGLHVAILGKPNVGKSSLFNALLQEDRAIVHTTPGTTRDILEAALNLKGVLVRFLDTAGIRTGEDAIEAEGIRRAREKLERVDLILVVIDASRPLDNEDQSVLKLAQNKKTLLLYNKGDLPSSLSENDIQTLSQSASLKISAKTGSGIEELKEKILSSFLKPSQALTSDGLMITNLRHHVALAKGLAAVEQVQHSSREKRSLEFLVADLSVAMEALGEITGEVTNDEILGEIFSRFCLGK